MRRNARLSGYDEFLAILPSERAAWLAEHPEYRDTPHNLALGRALESWKHLRDARREDQELQQEIAS
jgi:hypothetical protein